MTKYNFTFNTADAIELRKQVLRFYAGIIGRSFPNVIDEKEPWADVTNDFQLLMYMYLMTVANEQVEMANQIKDDKGKSYIKGEAKVILSYYRNDYKRISTYFPTNNMTFVSQYADVSDAMDQAMSMIVTQTYYPMLNNILQSSHGCDSQVAQVTARLVTAVCFLVMAVQTGMHDTHKVPSPLFAQVVDRLCRLTCYVTHVNRQYIEMNNKVLEKNCETTRNVVMNIAQPLMEAIMDHAKSLNLYHYVKCADYTLKQFRELKAKVQHQMHKTIVEKP